MPLSRVLAGLVPGCAVDRVVWLRSAFVALRAALTRPFAPGATKSQREGPWPGNLAPTWPWLAPGATGGQGAGGRCPLVARRANGGAAAAARRRHGVQMAAARQRRAASVPRAEQRAQPGQTGAGASRLGGGKSLTAVARELIRGGQPGERRIEESCRPDPPSVLGRSLRGTARPAAVVCERVEGGEVGGGRIIGVRGVARGRAK
jgi:hypothetical protein